LQEIFAGNVYTQVVGWARLTMRCGHARNLIALPGAGYHNQHGKRLLLYNTPWLAMSQPFGLRMLLGVPQKRLACWWPVTPASRSIQAPREVEAHWLMRLDGQSRTNAHPVYTIT